MLADLAPAVDSIRLSLHVLAAAVWVGGQITLAGMVPTVRGLSEAAPSLVARRFALIAWPAYTVLLATGIWNAVAAHPDRHSSAWKTVLAVKISIFVLAGLAAWLHTRAASRTALAAWGAISGVTSLTALTLGILLAG